MIAYTAPRHVLLAEAWQIALKARTTSKSIRFQIEEIEKRLGTSNEKPEDMTRVRELGHQWLNEASKAAYPCT